MASKTIIISLLLVVYINNSLAEDFENPENRHHCGCPYKPTKPPKIKCTRPHEEYQCGSACQTRCANLGQVCPIKNIKCNDACYCVKGYARDSSGTCIPIKDCPPPINCSRPHEEYKCGSACQTECATLGQTCPIVNKKCNDGCYCKEGYARDSSGRCIPIEECPIKPPLINCTRPFEEYQCGSACQTTCQTLGQICPIVNVRCNDDCYCIEGYARDFIGRCIPIKECPPPIKCTRPYEEYQCGSACQTTCQTLGQICPIVNVRCNDDCYCIEGYARDFIGRCIPIKECPPPISCTRPYEEYQCGSACQTTCQTLGEICPIVNVRCNDDCYCIEGYARDFIGRCISINECPPKIVCSKPNEEYQCGSACQTECATLGQICPIVNVRCNDDCYCKEGYARDSKGYCIPINDCPPNANVTQKG